MFYYKNYHDNHSKRETSNFNLDFNEYQNLFNFLDWINHQKRDQIKEIFNSKVEIKDKELSYIADIASSTLAKFYEKGFIKKKIIRDGLDLCEKIIKSFGYDLVSKVNMDSQDLDEYVNVMIVAGCQSDKLLYARVKKCVEIVEESNQHLNIFFVGSNPNREDFSRKIQKPNEANEMEVLFKFLLSKSSQKRAYSTIRIDKEGKSYDTISNIENVFQKEIMNSDKKKNILLLSSTFHLIRLSKSFEDYVNNMYEKKETIERIFLIGSENTYKINKVSKLPNYLKSMIYELFIFLFRDESFHITYVK